ncbi:hypothetical protein BD626DRAFT_495631 [Schizophyllum amplum]|uniref:Palmitoyltransferase n=1 Tax=Schizophyllum amplum TaxID=97359 RepID=A0A550CEC1_9AGAR|nr:hypothetical protein BD626DRAFT_495631 [Auriculariopsis ampla]
MDHIGGPSYEQQKAAPPRTFTRAAPNTLSVPTDPQPPPKPPRTRQRADPATETRPATALSPFSAEYRFARHEELSMASDSTAPTKPFPGLRKTARRGPPPVPYLREEQRYCTRCRIVKPYRAHIVERFFFNFCEAAWAFTTYTFATLVGFVASHADIDIDAQIIVIIALSALFMSFTAALVIAHARQIMIGQTTVELMHIRGLKERDSAMLARVFSLWEMGAKKRTRARWDAEWGSPDREGNLWWQGSTRAEWVSVMGESWIGWIFPIGRGPSNGMDYVPNPRFDSEGRPRPREQWPEELR